MFSTYICKVKYNPCDDINQQPYTWDKSYVQILSSMFIHYWTKELEFKTSFILLDMPHTPLG
jgi:hypothetical protein